MEENYIKTKDAYSLIDSYKKEEEESIIKNSKPIISNINKNIEKYTKDGKTEYVELIEPKFCFSPRVYKEICNTVKNHFENYGYLVKIKKIEILGDYYRIYINWDERSLEIAKKKKEKEMNHCSIVKAVTIGFFVILVLIFTLALIFSSYLNF